MKYSCSLFIWYGLSTWILFNTLRTFFSTEEGRKTMVSEIPFTVRQEVCNLLRVERTFGGDFRSLAGDLRMDNSKIQVISKKDNPADEVLTWWEPQRSATVQKFREILVRMKRDDVVEILDREYPTGTENIKIRKNFRSRSLLF